MKSTNLELDALRVVVPATPRFLRPSRASSHQAGNPLLADADAFATKDAMPTWAPERSPLLPWAAAFSPTRRASSGWRRLCGALHPVTQRGLGEIQVPGHLADRAITELAEPYRISIDFRAEGPPRASSIPLGHRTLRALRGVHETGAAGINREWER